MAADIFARRKPWHGLFERLLSEWDEWTTSHQEDAEAPLVAGVYPDLEGYRAELHALFHGIRCLSRSCTNGNIVIGPQRTQLHTASRDGLPRVTL
jgi:hypothetical protein